VAISRASIGAPPRLPLDGTLDITVGGLRPGQDVTLTAVLHAPDGLRWASSARFAAGRDGTVAPSRVAPQAGSYQGIDGNGLLWSLAPDRPAAAESSALLSGLEPAPVKVRCTAGGQVLGDTVVTIDRVAPGTRTAPVREAGLHGELFVPPGVGPFRPVLVLGGSGGDANEPLAAFLAGHGYLALALSYFAAPGLPDELVEIDLEYFGRALSWLASRPGAAGPAAVVGRSRGGELALLLGLHLGVHTVIAFVPSPVVHAGIRKGADGWLSDVPAWRVGGRPLPYLPHAGGRPPVRDGAVVCTPVYLAALADWDRVAAAMMPLQDCPSRVLLISGTSDRVWPSTLFAELAMAALRQRRGGRGQHHLALPGAGHRFLPPVLPATVPVIRHAQAGQRLALGGTAVANATGGARANAAMLAVLGGGTGGGTDEEGWE
jgi:dienelactone hydrolase